MIIIKKAVTFVIGVILSLSISSMMIHFISHETLLNQEWVLKEYKSNNFSEKMVNAIHQYLSHYVYQTTGVSYSFKEVVSEALILDIMEYRTDQIIKSKKTKTDPVLDYDISANIHKIEKELADFPLTDREIQAVVDLFKIRMNGHFFTPINDPDFDPQLSLNSSTFYIIEQLTKKIAFQFSFVIASLTLVNLILIYRKQLSEVINSFIVSLFFSGFTLFLSFVLARNLHYPRSSQTVYDIKSQLFISMLNNLYKIIYTTGYSVVIFSITLYILLIIYRNFKKFFKITDIKLECMD